MQAVCDFMPRRFATLLTYAIIYDYTYKNKSLCPRKLLNKLNNLKNRATVDYYIEKSKEDKKKT